MVQCEHSIKVTYYSINVQIIINLATVIKFYRLGGLNNKHLCLMFLESGKSKTTVVQSDSGKDIFPGFLTG